MLSGFKKKTYHSPELMVHGSVEKITEGAEKTPGSADGQGSRILPP